MEKQLEKVLPKKGLQFPAHWDAVGLPPPGNRRVPKVSVSARSAAYLERFKETMLKKDWQTHTAKAEDIPYIGPTFSKHG